MQWPMNTFFDLAVVQNHGLTVGISTISVYHTFFAIHVPVAGRHSGAVEAGLRKRRAGPMAGRPSGLSGTSPTFGIERSGHG